MSSATPTEATEPSDGGACADQQLMSIGADETCNIVTAQSSEQKLAPHEVAQQVLNSHEACVFRASNRPVNVRDIQLPESFFDPSSGELSSAFQTYAHRSDQLRNAPLKTKKMREAEAQQRMSRFRKVLVRMQLPDRVMVQGTFTPQTQIRQVVRFLRAALIDARNVNFHLFVVPPKRTLNQMDATLWDEGLVPAAVVHVGIDAGPSESGSLLKEHLVAGMQDAPEVRTAIEPLVTNADDTVSAGNESANTEALKEKGKTTNARKVPKWFKK